MSSARKWSVIGISFALVASAGCEGLCEHSAGYGVRFQVVDADSQLPLANTRITVELRGMGRRISRSISFPTDAEGEYQRILDVDAFLGCVPGPGRGAVLGPPPDELHIIVPTEQGNVEVRVPIDESMVTVISDNGLSVFAELGIDRVEVSTAGL